MKVDLGTIEIDDDMRRAIRRDVGKDGLATRGEVRRFFIDHATAVLVVKVVEQDEEGRARCT